MRVLHLTDLFISASGDHLERWTRALPHVDSGVRFVVVSGDLVRTGQSDEYAEALRFMQERLLPLVDGDPARVVIVPGNLDSDALPQAKPFQRFGANGKKKKPGERRHLREPLGSAGRPPRRFERFQSFIDSFYGTSLSSPHRKFNMTAADQSWSAHVFASDGVAFYGLSTCRLVDDPTFRAARYLRNVGKHVKEHAQELLTLGVWHHGLGFRRGADDFLTPLDLGAIRARGRLRAGFHGHLRHDEVNGVHEELRRALALIGTAPFGSLNRADSRPSQFSLVDILPGSLRAERYEQKGPDAAFGRVASKVYRFPRSNRPRASRARAHSRHVTLDEKGIAELKIVFEGLKQEGGAVLLASLTPGFTNSEQGALRLRSDSAPLDAQPSVRLRNNCYVLSASTRFYDELEWRCWYSNGYGLTATDCKLATLRSRALLADMAADEDAFVHNVYIRSDVLELSVNLPREPISGARVIAQKGFYWGDSALEWEDDENEMSRIAPGLKVDGSKLRLAIALPRIAYRYGIRYRLPPGRTPLAHETAQFLDTLLTDFRTMPERETPATRPTRELRQNLVAAISRQIRAIFRLDSIDDLKYVVHLWSDTELALLPAFGSFPPETWGSRFAYGVGIAGHAFRDAKPTMFVDVPGTSGAEDDIRRSRLIYRQSRRATPGRRWVIVVPLSLNRTDVSVPIGVLGFEGRDEGNAVQRTFARIASGLAGDKPTAEQDKKRLNYLSEMVSQDFWYLTSYDHDEAERIRQTFWDVTTSSSPPVQGESTSSTPRVLPASERPRLKLAPVALPPALREAYRDGTLALLVGSGASGAALPRWREIPDRLLKQIKFFDLREDIPSLEKTYEGYLPLDEMLAQLDTLKTILSRDRKYHGALRALFRPPDASPSETQEIIGTLKVPLVATTNYDLLLEACLPSSIVYTWRDAGRVQYDLDQKVPVLFKVHGTAERDDTVIMTQSEYRTLAADPSYPRVMAFLLQRYTFLCIGYGVNDPLDLDVVLNTNTTAFKQSTKTHYALIQSPTDMNRDRWTDQFNVRAISYSDHAQVPLILKSLRDDAP